MDPRFAYLYNSLNCKVTKLCKQIEYQEKCILVLKEKLDELTCILNKDQIEFNGFKTNVLDMESILNTTFNDDLMDDPDIIDIECEK